MEAISTTTVQIIHLKADEVYLIGDFNHWSVPGKRMRKVRHGCWEADLGFKPIPGRLACAALIQGRVIEVIDFPVGKTLAAGMTMRSSARHDQRAAVKEVPVITGNP